MNKLDKLIERLQKREVVFAENYMLTQSTVLTQKANLPEIDFVLFDCEHGVFNNENLIPQLQVCRLCDFPSIVRVGEPAYHLIARAIDLGADGIMLPRTETVEQVKAAVDAMRLPPIGKTGNGGHGQHREGEPDSDYQKKRLLMVQIESKKGLENMPAMIKAYGDQIACFIIGPYDLSITMGITQQFDNPEFLATVQEIFDTAASYNKSVGIYCDTPELAHKYHKMGANILWVGTDEQYFINGIKAKFEPLYHLRNEENA